MKRFAKNGTLFGVLAVVFAFIGCACSSQIAPTPLAMVPHTYRVTGARINLNAAADDLVYVADDQSSYQSTVDIYSWQSWKQVGTITGFLQPWGLCTDKAQHVYVVDLNTSGIYEFTHRGTGPIKTLFDPYAAPWGCAVDPRTGNLAVSDWFENVGNAGIVIFSSGSITEYKSTNASGFDWLGYDDDGNLFVSGLLSNSEGEAFWEIPAGSMTFTQISLPLSVYADSGVQWDGKYMAVGDAFHKSIHQLAVSGSTATLEGTTSLHITNDLYADFYVPRFGSDSQQGTRVAVSDFGITRSGQPYYIGKFLYPGGGSAIKLIQTPTGSDSAEGIVVSKGRHP